MLILDISCNHISPKGSEVLFRSLHDNINVVSVVFGSRLWDGKNWLGISGAKAVRDLLRSSKSNTQILGFWGSRLGKVEIKIISEGAKTNKSLISLELQRNDWVKGDKLVSKSICNIIELGVIQKLDLSYTNFLDRQTMMDLSDWISKDSLKLSHLKLKSCKITELDISPFYFALEENTSLRSLNLSFNNLNGPSTSCWEMVLSENKSLASINLSHWNLSKEALLIIIDALHTNFVVDRLNLWHNNMTDQEGIAFCELLSNEARLAKM
jgi:hypothetical protein